MSTHRIRVIAIAATLSVTAWAVDPNDFEDYLTDSLPATWHYESQFSQQSPVSDRWWREFNDATLDTLISMAVDNNFDLLTAARRIEMARNNIRLAQSAYYPTVSMSAGWNRTRSSGATASSTTPASTASYFDLGLTASWEVDLFGKITAAAKEKKLVYKATRAEYDAAMVSLCAELATDYVKLRVWQAQYELANRHIETQQRIVDITEARLEAGIGSMLDVTQAKIVLSSTKATIPSLENSIHTMINAIALLTGSYPDELPVDLNQSGRIPDYRMLVPTGVPADLLRRRPDIAAAEMQLAASAASIGIAKKDFLPTLTINGSVGTSAHSAGDLFKHNSFGYTIAPTLTWTVFSGLSRSYNVANARREMEIEINAYNLAVMNAVNEADNAMDGYLAAVRHIDALQEVAAESKTSLHLSVDLYKQGLTNFSNVSDAQLSLLESQSSVITARGDALAALIDLYQALGGGWNGQY